jgi:hypothetical protein
MKIRKQVYDLTLDDLNEYPVWEFALDEEGEEGQDEATVRPYGALDKLNPSDGMFIVRAKFTLADGSQMHGCLTPPSSKDDGLGVLQPVIITKDGQILFWCGVIEPNANDLAQSYKKLGRHPSEIFPIKVISDVDLVGGPVCASIPGFIVLEDLGTEKVRILT